jgi:hypothetical protein
MNKPISSGNGDGSNISKNQIKGNAIKRSPSSIARKLGRLLSNTEDSEDENALVISPEVRHIARKLQIAKKLVEKKTIVKPKTRNRFLSKIQIDTNTMKNPIEENKKREGENKNMIKNHIEDIIGFIQEKEELAREVTKSKSRKMKIGNMMKRNGKLPAKKKDDNDLSIQGDCKNLPSDVDRLIIEYADTGIVNTPEEMDIEIDQSKEYVDSSDIVLEAVQEETAVAIVNVKKVKNKAAELLVLWNSGERTWDPYTLVNADFPGMYQKFIHANKYDEKTFRKNKPKNMDVFLKKTKEHNRMECSLCDDEFHTHIGNYLEETLSSYCGKGYDFFQKKCDGNLCTLTFTNERVSEGKKFTTEIFIIFKHNLY